MKSRIEAAIKPAFLAIGVLLMAACATTNPTPSTPPSATVRVEAVSAAYYGSAGAGKGTLNYQGHVHHFTTTGLGAGGMGAQNVS